MKAITTTDAYIFQEIYIINCVAVASVTENDPVEYYPYQVTPDDEDVFFHDYVDNIWPTSVTYWTLTYSTFYYYFDLLDVGVDCYSSSGITSDD
jgi:hypothetical protein